MWGFSLLSSNSQMAWDIDTLAQFESRIDWLCLSGNTGVRWTEALLDRYKTKLVWTDLAANPAFPIEPAILEQFAPFISWIYLSSNPALPLDDAFLRRYEDNIHWQILRNYRDDLSEVHEPFSARLEALPKQRYQQNGSHLLRYYLRSEIHPESLTGRLYNRLDQPVSQIEPAFLKEFHEYWNWEKLSYGRDVHWSIPFYERFYHLLNEGVSTSAGFYRSVLQPVLHDALIDEVCARLNPEGGVPFYYLEGKRDEYGTLPNVRHKLPGDPPWEAYRRVNEQWAALFSGDDLSASIPEVRFELDWFLRHPIRFADYHEWPFQDHYSAIVVSGKMKSMLEQFKLPPHRFYPIELAIANDVFGTEHRDYYIFYVPEQEYLYFDYEKTVWVEDEDRKQVPNKGGMYHRPYYTSSYFTRQTAAPYPAMISSPEAYLQAKQELLHRNPLKKLRPREYIWKADFDLLPSGAENPRRHIWISEDVRKAMEAAGLEGIRFERVWECRPRMEALETPARREKNERIIRAVRAEFGDREPDPEQLTVRNFKQAEQWAQEVCRHQGIVRKMYTENPPSATDDALLLKIREKEVELDVVFPTWFIEILRSGNLPSDLEDYTLIPLENIGCWQLLDDFPLSVKSVPIAEYSTSILFLLLKKDSFYELDDAIWMREYDQGPPPSVIRRM